MYRDVIRDELSKTLKNRKTIHGKTARYETLTPKIRYVNVTWPYGSLHSLRLRPEQQNTVSNISVKSLSILPRTLLTSMSISTGEEEFEDLDIPDDLEEIILADVSELTAALAGSFFRIHLCTVALHGTYASPWALSCAGNVVS